MTFCRPEWIRASSRVLRQAFVSVVFQTSLPGKEVRLPASNRASWKQPRLSGKLINSPTNCASPAVCLDVLHPLQACDPVHTNSSGLPWRSWSLYNTGPLVILASRQHWSTEDADSYNCWPLDNISLHATLVSWELGLQTALISLSPWAANKISLLSTLVSWRH